MLLFVAEIISFDALIWQRKCRLQSLFVEVWHSGGGGRGLGYMKAIDLSMGALVVPVAPEDLKGLKISKLFRGFKKSSQRTRNPNVCRYLWKGGLYSRGEIIDLNFSKGGYDRIV